MSADAETWAIDELWRVLGADVVRSPRREYTGGEWDYLKSLPLATRRRLIGGRYLLADGLAPDVAADIICAAVPECETTCDAMEWYVRTALTAIVQTRKVAEQRRYRARVQRAHDAGQDSYHYHRLAKSIGL